MENKPFRFKDYARYWAGEQATLADFAFLEIAPAPERSPLSQISGQQARARA